MQILAMMMPGVSEILVIVLIIVLIFGAKKLPKLGEGLGKGIRNFKDSLSGKKDHCCDDSDEHKKLDDK